MAYVVQQVPRIEQLASKECVEGVRRALAGVRSLELPLEPFDRFIITVLVVCQRLERDTLPRGKQLDLAAARDCFLRALDLVATADKQFAVEAGYLGRLSYFPHDWQQVIEKRIGRWVEEYVTLPSPCDREACERLTDRQRALIAINVELSDERVVSRSDLYGKFARGKRLAAAKRGEKVGSDDQELHRTVLWGDIRIALTAVKDISKVLVIDREGRIGFGVHGARDTQPQSRTDLGNRMLSLDEEVGEGRRAPRMRTLEDQVGKRRARDPVRGDLRRGIRKTLQVFMRRELPRSTLGSARQVVLENLVALGLRDATMREVSSRSGRSESSLSRAYKLIRGELRRLHPLEDLARDL